MHGREDATSWLRSKGGARAASRWCRPATTPAALVCTRGGLPRHLSVDTLRGLGPGPGAVRGCHVCGLDLLTRADQGAHIAAAGGLHGYTGLDAEVLVVDPRDPVSHGLGWKQQGAAAVRGLRTLVDELDWVMHFLHKPRSKLTFVFHRLHN